MTELVHNITESAGFNLCYSQKVIKRQHVTHTFPGPVSEGKVNRVKII